jgi:hypothetical protein
MLLGAGGKRYLDKLGIFHFWKLFFRFSGESGNPKYIKKKSRILYIYKMNTKSKE